MAKKKSKKKSRKGFLGLGIGGFIVVIVAVLVCILLFVSPNVDRYSSQLDKKTDLVTVITSNTPILGIPYSVANIDATVSYVDGNKGLGSVTYYANAETAKKAYSQAKETAKDDDSIYTFKRGNAVYLGSKEGFKVFLLTLV